MIDLAEQDLDRALRTFGRALEKALAGQNEVAALAAILGIATAAAGSNPRAAARLSAAAHELAERRQIAFPLVIRGHASGELQHVRLTLGETEFESEQARGRELPRDRAVAEALALAAG
jgi:hypothetical protein